MSVFLARELVQPLIMFLATCESECRNRRIVGRDAETIVSNLNTKQEMATSFISKSSVCVEFLRAHHKSTHKLERTKPVFNTSIFFFHLSREHPMLCYLHSEQRRKRN